MLVKLHTQLENDLHIKSEKCSGRRDVSLHGAFPQGTVLDFQHIIPRKMGVFSVVLRLHFGLNNTKDFPFELYDIQNDEDIYRLHFDTKEILNNQIGLYYYEFIFLRGLETLFSTTYDFVHMNLTDHSDQLFPLLIYHKDFRTPKWFHGGNMYHIFVDRYGKGAGPVTYPSYGTMIDDWENGPLEYAKIQGGMIDNTTFYGGNLWGIVEHLDDIQKMGFTTIYLSPIFKARTNHRYDIGDYEIIDPLLGGIEAFQTLCKEIHKRKMYLILDGVFNHTGIDSKYFNYYATYPNVGAYQSKESPYYPWYEFQKYPDKYTCWWDIPVLPRLNQNNDNCKHYFTKENGIIQKWLKEGADGWRLDVADELPNHFLEELRTKAKSCKNALIIGEVWENATEKIAYGQRRHYFEGFQLDSVMNYPLRTGIINFILYQKGMELSNTLTSIYASYPKTVCDSLMNILSSHDTERILTLLGDDGEGQGLSNDELYVKRLTEQQKRNGIKLLKIAAVLQFTTYGVPSVFYGDEVGMEGYHDPFCRRCYPWNHENHSLKRFYQSLCRIRRDNIAFQTGDFQVLFCSDTCIVYKRHAKKQDILVIANVGPSTSYKMRGVWKNLFNGTIYQNIIHLRSQSAIILIQQKYRNKV